MSQLVQGMRAGWRGGRGLLRKAPVLGRDRQFESVFLQRRVVRTMVTAATWSRTGASVSRLSLVSCFQVTSTPWGSDKRQCAGRKPG